MHCIPSMHGVIWVSLRDVVGRSVIKALRVDPNSLFRSDYYVIHLYHPEDFFAFVKTGIAESWCLIRERAEKLITGYYRMKRLRLP